MTGARTTNRLTIRQVLARGHQRLVLFAVVLATGSLAVSGLALVRSYTELSLELAGRSVAYSVEPAVFFGDKEGAAEAIGSVAALNNVQQVKVQDARGVTLASWARTSSESAYGLDRLLNRILWPKPYVIPIVHQKPIGRILIWGNANGLASFLLSALAVALSCCGITLIATRMLARQLQNSILVPLSHVAEVADTVRYRRDFTRRVSPSGIAEVDDFGDNFNALLKEMESWHHALTEENEALAYQAEHDVLTGLGNRLMFERALDTAIAAASATSDNFAILFIDLNRFKAINDTYGHFAGDRVLVEFAERLRRTMRGYDHVFRLGGDEFAVVLNPSHGLMEPHQISARIEAALLPPVILESGERVRISLSIGQASYPDDGTNAGDLTQSADRTMYRKKREVEHQ